MSEMSVSETIALAIRHHEAGELQEAEPLYERVLAQEPENAEVLNRAGVLAFQMGRREAAVDFVQRAAAVAGERADYQYNLGIMLRMTGRLDEAIAAFSKAVELQADHADAYNDLGVALASRGRLDEAIAAFRQALVFRSDFGQALHNMGNVLARQKKSNDAIAAYRHAIAMNPDFLAAYISLAGTLCEDRRFDEGIAAYRNAIFIKADHAPCLNALGRALRETGQIEEALDYFRRAVEAAPEYADARSNLIYALEGSDQGTPEMIEAEKREFNARVVEPLGSSTTRHENVCDADRRLRVGYMSDHFHSHQSAMVLDPLLRSHDRQKFEIFCYADMQWLDVQTRRYESYVDQFRYVFGMSDEQLALLIREDKIDILVDLKLHAETNRLGVFARKPAPVQVSWLEYPGTTGVQTIDYRLTDGILEPSGEKSFSAEEGLRLPRNFWVFDSMGEEPGVNALPALKNGYITFGCLNSFSKITDRMLNLWLRILKAGSARLVLQVPQGSARSRIWEKADQAGIDPNRVEYVDVQPRGEYLEIYHRIDLGLDTLPSNGQVTTLDSLWMGVPVLTLAGKTPMGRAGASLLSAVDLAGFVARNEEELVRLAAILSSNLARLGEIRSGLRERMKKSPLMDAAGFAAGMEAAYRTIWGKWCAGNSGR
jgi:protein O-GlcNAc transferase